MILNSRFTDKTKTTANHTDLLKVNGDELRILLADGLDHLVSPLGRQGFRILEDGPDVGRDEKEGGGGDVVDRGRGVGSSDGGFGDGPDFRRIFLVGVGGHMQELRRVRSGAMNEDAQYLLSAPFGSAPKYGPVTVAPRP